MGKSYVSRPYNGFSGETRAKMGDLQVELLSRHPEYRQTVCTACGWQAQGVTQHLEDYNEPLKGIIGLCMRCHVMVHERFRFPERWVRYVAMIREGFVFPPVFNWMTALRDCCDTEAAFVAAKPGPARGRTILDEIATGKWLEIGGEVSHADVLAVNDAMNAKRRFAMGRSADGQTKRRQPGLFSAEDH